MQFLSWTKTYTSINILSILSTPTQNMSDKTTTITYIGMTLNLNYVHTNDVINIAKIITTICVILFSSSAGILYLLEY